MWTVSALSELQLAAQPRATLLVESAGADIGACVRVIVIVAGAWPVVIDEFVEHLRKIKK